MGWWRVLAPSLAPFTSCSEHLWPFQEARSVKEEEKGRLFRLLHFLESLSPLPLSVISRKEHTTSTQEETEAAEITLAGCWRMRLPFPNTELGQVTSITDSLSLRTIRSPKVGLERWLSGPEHWQILQRTQVLLPTPQVAKKHL